MTTTTPKDGALFMRDGKPSIFKHRMGKPGRFVKRYSAARNAWELVPEARASEAISAVIAGAGVAVKREGSALGMAGIYEQRRIDAGRAQGTGAPSELT